MGLYAESSAQERAQVTAEYTAVLGAYLSSRLEAVSVATGRPRRPRHAAAGSGA